MKKKYKKINQILFNDFSEQKPIKLLGNISFQNQQCFPKSTNNLSSNNNMSSSKICIKPKKVFSFTYSSVFNSYKNRMRRSHKTLTSLGINNKSQIETSSLTKKDFFPIISNRSFRMSNNLSQIKIKENDSEKNLLEVHETELSNYENQPDDTIVRNVFKKMNKKYNFIKDYKAHLDIDIKNKLYNVFKTNLCDKKMKSDIDKRRNSVHFRFRKIKVL